MQTLAPYLPDTLVTATAGGATAVEILLSGALLLGVRNTMGCSRQRRNTGRVRRVDVHLRRHRDTAKCIAFHRCRGCAASRVGTARKLRRQPRPSARFPNFRTGHGEINLIPIGMCNRLPVGAAGYPIALAGSQHNSIKHDHPNGFRRAALGTPE